jgi:hypothetical protein
MLSAFDVATMKSTSLAHVVSPKDTDANTPHVTSRPGGYWLAYLARGEEDSKKRKKHHDEDDDDQRDQGEAITTSWVEVIPLDEDGAPIGGPRAVTPKSGHVLSFDLVLADNGNALVAFRDNDTPAGGAGGKVSATLVRLGGGGEPHVLFDQGGTGSPDLLPGWISIASVSGATRIAGVSPMGDLLDDLASEPALGAGEPIAARGDAILWARPLGKAMRLSMVRCHPRERAVDAGEANAGDGGA